MSLTPKIILDDFERHRWNSKPSPMDGTLQLMQEQPEAMVELVIGAMDRRIASETFIDTAIDLMEDEAFTPNWGQSTDGLPRNWKRRVKHLLAAAPENRVVFPHRATSFIRAHTAQ